MKNFNSNSSHALSRFAKDKRLRTEERGVRGKEERGERNTGGRRASFNPNFTEDNRPKRSAEGGERTERKQFGAKSATRKPFGAGRSDRNERSERTFKGKNEGFKKSEGFNKGGRKPFGKSEGYKGKSKPAAIKSSASRREQSPDCATKRFKRISPVTLLGLYFG